MEGKPVVVVGSMNIDLVSKTPRFPRAGETVVGDGFYMSFGGKGANQAVTIARLGVPVIFVGCVGDDAFGRDMVAHARSEKIETRNIRVVPGRPSGTAMILVDSKGQNQIVIVPGANEELNPKDVDRAEKAVSSAAVVVTQFETPLETVRHVIQMANKHGIPIILNPAPASEGAIDSSLLKQVDVLVPNETEAEAITGVSPNSADFPMEALKVLREKGAGTTIITLGDKGAMLADSKKMWHIPAFKVEPVDTTGAGDAFVGALAAGYHFFPDLRVLAGFASAVGALTVMKQGAQTSLPVRQEVDEFLLEHSPELLEKFRAMSHRE